MDKDFIRLGLRSELHKIEEAHGYDAITVPKRKTIACTFKPTKRKGDVRIPFEDLVDITVLCFALEIASKKSAGDLGADFLGKIRNRLRFLRFPLGKQQKSARKLRNQGGRCPDPDF